MKKIIITVSDLDQKKILKIGLTPWTQLKEDQLDEYNSLASFYGAEVLLKVIEEI